MLVLSRRPGEGINIGSNIEVVVLGTQGGRVRLGISAGSNVRVLRSELLERAVEMDEAPLPDMSLLAGAIH